MAMVRVDIPAEDIRPDVVRDALAGRVPRIPPSVALALIADLDIPQTDQQTLLQEAVQDSRLEQHVRAAVIRAYMRLGAERAAPDLLKLLDPSAERVAAAAAAALGHVGTPEHLPALQRIRNAGELLRQRVAFAEVLIVHRFGVSDHNVEFPPAEAQQAPAAVGGLVFTCSRPGLTRRARALEGIKREFPSLDSAKQDVYEIQCGPRLMEVAIDRGFVEANGPEELGKRPALPAIVAFQDVEYDEEFHPRLVVLSRPSGRGRITLLLTRLGGDPVYVGEGAVNRGEAEFEVHSAQTPGIPAVNARVRVTAKGIEITGTSDRSSAPARSPAQA
jgi:HEAT repeats